jgi:hypothetical protein
VYTTAKLQPDALERLPQLRPTVRNLDRLDREKAILDLAGLYPGRLGATAPLRAIVVPRLGSQVRVSSATPGTVLRAMAPSTIFGLFGATSRTLSLLARLAEDIPGYVLELGADAGEVADAVATLAGAP